MNTVPSAQDIFKQMQNDGRVGVTVMFDNNPVGFRQVFTTAGYPCNAITVDDALLFVAKLVQDNAISNEDIARCLVSIPPNGTANNYTTTTNYWNAIMMYSDLKNR